MTEQPAPSRKWRRLFLPAVFAAGTLAIAAIYVFLHAGIWLVREDSLEKSRAIVVLSGGLPDRALAAAQVYRSGYGAEVWLTQPLQPSAAMRELGLPYAGEEEYSRMVLIEKGVPPAKIRILQPRILDTADELRAVADSLDQQTGQQEAATAIIVTSKAHTRRVRAIWYQISPGHHGHALIRAAPNDAFDPSRWWGSTNDALTVVREYLGLLNTWAGLPLHHTH